LERIVAIDIGSVRIGVAVSDPFGSFAQALTVLSAKDDWIEELKKIIRIFGNIHHFDILTNPLHFMGAFQPQIHLCDARRHPRRGASAAVK